MNGRISLIIHSVCKQHKIDYKSEYYEKHVFLKDATRLAEIYRTLRMMIQDLVDIEERHNIGGIGRLLKDDIHKLINIDHDLLKATHVIIKEEEKNESKKS